MYKNIGIFNTLVTLGYTLEAFSVRTWIELKKRSYNGGIFIGMITLQHNWFLLVLCNRRHVVAELVTSLVSPMVVPSRCGQLPHTCYLMTKIFVKQNVEVNIMKYLHVQHFQRLVNNFEKWKCSYNIDCLSYNIWQVLCQSLIHWQCRCIAQL